MVSSSVSFVAVAVNATIGVFGARDRNSYSFPKQ